MHPGAMAWPLGAVPALLTQRWFDAGVSPLRRWAAITAGLLSLLVTAEVLLGRASRITEPGVARQIRIAVVLMLLIGYLPAALAWSARGLRQQLAALRPLLPSAHAALDEASAAAGTLPRRRARRAGALGALCGLAIPFTVDRDPSLYLRASYWSSESLLHWVLCPIVTFMVARVGLALWTDSRRLSGLAPRLEEIDLSAHRRPFSGRPESPVRAGVYGTDLIGPQRPA